MAALIDLVLAVFKDPGLVADLRDRPLPEDVGQAIRLAAGEAAALQAAQEMTGVEAETLVEASVFFLQQLLFAPQADSYRVLGAQPDAPQEQLREHYRWLIKWLHPDRNQDGWEAIYTDRVNIAWQDLKTPERRAEYDRRLQTMPTPQLPVPTARRRPVATGVRAPMLSGNLVRRLPAIVLGTAGGLALLLVAGMYWAQMATQQEIAARQRDAQVPATGPATAAPEPVSTSAPTAWDDPDPAAAPAAQSAAAPALPPDSAPAPALADQAPAPDSAAPEALPSTPAPAATIAAAAPVPASAEPAADTMTATPAIAAAAPVVVDPVPEPTAPPPRISLPAPEAPAARPASGVMTLASAPPPVLATPVAEAPPEAPEPEPTQVASPALLPANATRPPTATAASGPQPAPAAAAPPAAMVATPRPSAPAVAAAAPPASTVTVTRPPAPAVATAAPPASTLAPRPSAPAVAAAPPASTLAPRPSAPAVAAAPPTSTVAAPAASATPARQVDTSAPASTGTLAGRAADSAVAVRSEAAAPAVLASASPPPPQRADAEALVREFAAAYAAGDRRRFDGLFSGDGGRTRAVESMRSRFDSTEMRFLEIQQLQWQMGAAEAQASGRFRDTYVPKGSRKAVTEAGVIEWVIRVDAGAARIALLARDAGP